jgi:hypothetical protein
VCAVCVLCVNSTGATCVDTEVESGCLSLEVNETS